MAVGGEPEPEPELGVVLEQRVRPRRAAAVDVGGPRRGRQVAAVDGRATGGVGDGQPVAEQLGEQLQVRRLAAAGAGAGELEQRIQELGAADGAEVDSRAVSRRQLFEERDVLALRVHQRLPRVEVDRLVYGLPARRHGTGLDAQPAAGAVLDVHLQGVTGVRQAGSVELSRSEALRRAVQARGLVQA